MDITLRVPIAQYAYAEVKGTPEELPEMEKFYNRMAEKPVTFRGAGEFSSEDPGQVITTFTGEQVRYWPKEHKYRTMENKKLLSGSHYAEQFAEPFDRDRLLAMTAKKQGCTVEHIAAAWDKRGEMARHFGTALHVAMESWFRFGKDTTYGIPKIQFLADAVESFPLKGEDVKPEIMVSDIARRLVGQIDGLLITGDMEGVILDYKTDSKPEKNLKKHAAQLGLYQAILEAHGWTITGRQIWSFTGAWKKFDLPEHKVTEETLRSCR